MMEFKKYESAVRWSLRKWIDEVKELDILVGIPTYNNEDTIANVVSTIGRGLVEYYPDMRSAMLISDGGSLDDTREKAYEAEIPEGVKRRVAIYRGKPGKGTSFRCIFETAKMLKVDVCMVADSDIKNITPYWVKGLIDPILKNEADFVTPYYVRHKYDGTITNNIIYPMVRALYGKRIRQPIGGEFGLCPDIVALFINEDVWDTDVAAFGIDVWMTVTAINEGYRVVQANLGSKIHTAKDPALDLGPMFRQVLGTFFYLMGKYEENWKKVRGSEEVPITGNPDGEVKLEPVPVSQKRLKDEFYEGFMHFSPLYKQVLDVDNYNALKGIVEKAKERGEVEFPPDLWARILYDFAFTFHAWSRNRRKLMDIMTPLYLGRVASYCSEVANMDTMEAEKVIEAQAQTFEDLKPYLIERFEVWE